ncbi:bacterial transcriptional activator domain-containing protein [Nocardia jinanensis]|uniref:bacterial transcriptional activator domain-containing protein n=1 Tax=Nocardia jinanensis TaxID=382504 RepID=UPI0035714C5A
MRQSGGHRHRSLDCQARDHGAEGHCCCPVDDRRRPGWAAGVGRGVRAYAGALAQRHRHGRYHRTPDTPWARATGLAGLAPGGDDSRGPGRRPVGRAVSAPTGQRRQHRPRQTHRRARCRHRSRSVPDRDRRPTALSARSGGLHYRLPTLRGRCTATPSRPHRHRPLRRLPSHRRHRCPGVLATDLPAAWAAPIREAARRDTITAVGALAAAAVEHDPRRALDLLETALDHDPLNELLWRDILRLHARLGEHTAIERTMSLLTQKLSDIGEQPTPQTRELAETLRRKYPH